MFEEQLKFNYTFTYTIINMHLYKKDMKMIMIYVNRSPIKTFTLIYFTWKMCHTPNFVLILAIDSPKWQITTHANLLPADDSYGNAQ